MISSSKNIVILDSNGFAVNEYMTPEEKQDYNLYHNGCKLKISTNKTVLKTKKSETNRTEKFKSY